MRSPARRPVSSPDKVFLSWFMARQTGLRQTASGFAMIWDDVLPPTPEDVHVANIATVVAAMDASART